MIERELIAELTIYAVDQDLRGREVRLMLGKPYVEEAGNWACPVALNGLHGKLADIRGDSSLQALILAKELIRVLLILFVEVGGKLYWEKGGDELFVDNLFHTSSSAVEKEDPEPLPPLSQEQQERVSKLTPEEIQTIDDSLMAAASSQFRKVARVVGTALLANRGSIPDVSDIYYALRVRKLVEEGQLVSEGNLDYMRFSEVKWPE